MFAWFEKKRRDLEIASYYISYECSDAIIHINPDKHRCIAGGWRNLNFLSPWDKYRSNQITRNCFLPLPWRLLPPVSWYISAAPVLHWQKPVRFLVSVLPDLTHLQGLVKGQWQPCGCDNLRGNVGKVAYILWFSLFMHLSGHTQTWNNLRIHNAHKSSSEVDFQEKLHKQYDSSDKVILAALSINKWDHSPFLWPRELETLSAFLLKRPDGLLLTDMNESLPQGTDMLTSWDF